MVLEGAEDVFGMSIHRKGRPDLDFHKKLKK